MGDDVLKLLCFLNWQKAGVEAIVIFLLFPFLWLKVGIDAHETGDPSHVLISKSLKILQNPYFRGFGPYIEQDTDLWVELAAEALEEPEVGGQFGAVGVFEAADDF